MKTKQLTLFYFLLFFFVGSANAQLDVPYSKVTLEDGSNFIANLLEVKDGMMEFQLTNGDIISVKQEEVKSISDEKYPVDYEPIKSLYKNTYDYQPGSMYYIFTFGGNLSRNETEFGIGADAIFSVGKQQSLKLGYGFSTGVDNLSVLGTAVIYPVLLEVRGYLKEKVVSPYYVLQAGYGFSKKSEKLGVLETRGGFTVRPAIGLRIGGRQRGNILLEVGYIFQPHYVKQTINISDIQEYTRVFNRLKIAIGIQF